MLAHLLIHVEVGVVGKEESNIFVSLHFVNTWFLRDGVGGKNLESWSIIVLRFI